MRSVVVGGAGFLGSHLVDRLVEKSWSTLVIDDLSSGSLENLAEARRFSRVGFHTLDLDHPQAGTVIERFDPEVVFYLADPPPRDRGLTDPVAAATIAVTRIARLAEMVRRTKSRLVLAVAASELYGNVAHQPVRESQRPHPMHPYGAALYAALRYVEARLGSNWCGLPMGSVYGPRQRPDRGAVAAMAREMLRGRVPAALGSSELARDYVYVEDAVDAVWRAGERGRGLVNIGTGVATPLSEVADVLAKVCDYTGSVDYVPDSVPQPETLALDPAAAGERLGWRPWTVLVDGLQRTIESWSVENQRSSAKWPRSTDGRSNAT